MGDLTVSVQAQVNVDQVKTTVNMNRQLKNILKSIGKSSILTIHHVKLASTAETNLRSQIENALKGITISDLKTNTSRITTSNGVTGSGTRRVKRRTNAAYNTQQKLLSDMESNLRTRMYANADIQGTKEFNDLQSRFNDWLYLKQSAANSGEVFSDADMKNMREESNSMASYISNLEKKNALEKEAVKNKKERQKEAQKYQDGKLDEIEKNAVKAVNRSDGYGDLLDKDSDYKKLYDQNKQRLKDYLDLRNEVKSGKRDLTDDLRTQLKQDGETIIRDANMVNEQIRNVKDLNKNVNKSQLQRQISRIQNNIRKNPKMKKDSTFDEYQSILSDLEGAYANSRTDKRYKNNEATGLSKKDYSSYIRQIRELEDGFKRTGNMSDTLGHKIKNMYQRFGGWALVTNSIYKAAEGIRLMVDDVRNIDSAMTELRKVTNETDSTYSKFLDGASDRAKGLGATIADTVDATADFVRMDYTLDEATELADAALVYKNVGDGIEDISTASESIISTMKAFGIEASGAMLIVDKFNEVGNNFAISSVGVGDALQRSASALAAGNNDLDESIALITAAM